MVEKVSKKIGKQEKAAVLKGVSDFQKEFCKECKKAAEAIKEVDYTMENVKDVYEASSDTYDDDYEPSEDELYNDAFIFMDEILEDQRDKFSEVLLKYLYGKKSKIESCTTRFNRFYKLEQKVSQIQ